MIRTKNGFSDPHSDMCWCLWSLQCDSTSWALMHCFLEIDLSLANCFGSGQRQTWKVGRVVILWIRRKAYRNLSESQNRDQYGLLHFDAMGPVGLFTNGLVDECPHRFMPNVLVSVFELQFSRVTSWQECLWPKMMYFIWCINHPVLVLKTKLGMREDRFSVTGKASNFTWNQSKC